MRESVFSLFLVMDSNCEYKKTVKHIIKIGDKLFNCHILDQSYIFHLIN